MSKAKYLIWHISDSEFGEVSLIRSWHKEKGWNDIGYHGIILNGFVTAKDFRLNRRIDFLNGSFQIGRVFDADAFIENQEIGAHAYGFNSESIGLCLIGKDGNFTPYQIETALKVSLEFMRMFEISLDNVIGHYELGRFKPEFATDKKCPEIDMSHIRDILKLEDNIKREISKRFVEWGMRGKK